VTDETIKNHAKSVSVYILNPEIHGTRANISRFMTKNFDETATSPLGKPLP
jgi:hypothetical protein